MSEVKHRSKGGSNISLPMAGAIGGDDNKRSRRSSSGNRSTFVATLFLIGSLALSATAGGGLVYLYLSPGSAATPTANDALPTEAKKLPVPSGGDAELLKAKITTLTNEKASLERQLNSKGDGSDDKIKSMEQRIERLKKYKQNMHEKLQAWSLDRLLEKYGAGPHFVDITVDFDPKSNVYGEGSPESHIIVQLADEKDMPHTVLWFLDQVDRKLYDNTSFHRNAGHVIQAGPTPNFKTPPNSELMKKFQKTGLANVLFQEYSPKHPHVKYTLGYAGRPGGPDFYISMQDNTKNHGPGGQGSYEDPTEADPCFAKVVKGFEVADRIHKSDVQEGNYKRMKNYVAITSMRLTLYKPEETPADES